MKVHQRDIVELNYELPNGSFKTHPALVISNENVLLSEDIFYALMISSKPMPDEFAIEVTNEMVSKPFTKKSLVKCQLIQSYSEFEVIKKYGFFKLGPFETIIREMMKRVFLPL